MSAQVNQILGESSKLIANQFKGMSERRLKVDEHSADEEESVTYHLHISHMSERRLKAATSKSIWG